ncbi:MAG: hypothetical protein A2636_02720 [Elusimicrobia bacterium RIFCSPHIGHO2_01_FULL_64_10]|nr:MAG: hypothetical protein A2636_02720 [Elusimicrobia bacterium RIFCSPHIGHO2_01_FULL_64_10]
MSEPSSVFERIRRARSRLEGRFTAFESSFSEDLTGTVPASRLRAAPASPAAVEPSVPAEGRPSPQLEQTILHLRESLKAMGEERQDLLDQIQSLSRKLEAARADSQQVVRLTAELDSAVEMIAELKDQLHALTPGAPVS